MGENTIESCSALPGVRCADEEEWTHRGGRSTVEMHLCALSTTCPSGRARRHEQADELADFIAWATSRHTQDEQEGSARAFRRRTCWCWQVPVPHPPVTGQVHDQIFIDGMHLSGEWVLLIARDREHVLEWQWAANESAQAYTALLERLAPADVVTTDGAAGAFGGYRAPMALHARATLPGPRSS